jgi:VanZ family protein
MGLAYVEPLLPVNEVTNITNSDKLNHVLAFFAITILARAAYPRASVILLLVLFTAFGALIELSQGMPFIHRDAEWRDWFADVAATLAGLTFARLFATLAKWARHSD